MARVRPITPSDEGAFPELRTALDASVTPLAARTLALGNLHQQQVQGIARQLPIAAETWARRNAIQRLGLTVMTDHGSALCLVCSRGRIEGVWTTRFAPC